MINSKKELDFFVIADRIINRGVSNYSLCYKIKEFFLPDYILRFLKALRYAEFYGNTNKFLIKTLYRLKLRKLGMKLGFSIAPNVFGYGLVIPHYGTIVVGEGNHVGNYCVLHTSTCITAGNKKIGDALYVSTGAKILHDIELGNNISISANSLVNNSFVQDGQLLVGMPAKATKDMQAWYIRDGEEFIRRVNLCEEIKKKMNL